MKLSLFIFLLFSYSFVFADFNKVNFASVFKIDEIHDSIQNERQIEGESGSLQKLIGVQLLGKDLSIIKYCLVYKMPNIPNKSFEGALKWVEIPYDMDCDSALNLEPIKEWNNISTIKSSLHGNEFTIDLNLKSSRRLRLNYQFYNLKKTTQSKVIFSKFETQNKIPGVWILSQQTKGQNWEKLKPTDYLNFRDVNVNNPCGGVRSDCSLLESRCEELCPSGWFWAPNGCPQGGSRYCGEDHCGEKGWPACLRGFGEINLSEKKDYKTDQSFVFCGEGLRAQPYGETIICD